MGKKTLYLKVTFIAILAVFLPYLIGLLVNLPQLLFVLLAIVSAISSVILLFWILKPLSKVSASVRMFSDGNLNKRVDIRTGDEFEEIGNSFNTLADKLSKTIHALENDRDIAISEKNKFNEILSSVIDGIIALDFNKNIIFINKASQQLIGLNEAEIYGKPIDQVMRLFSDNDEILSKTYCQGNFNQSAKLVGKDGKQTKVNLMTAQINGAVQTNLNCILILRDLSSEEELEQMKLDFVSMASHELKTPLTSIVGYLSVFLNEDRNKLPKENMDLLDKAFTAAQQLQTLIQNLLNVNKIEREQLSVSPEPVNYSAILSKTIEDLKGQAAQKNIILTLSVNDALPKVLADPIRIGEVITNLVYNAINYTDPGGKIDVSVKVLPDQVETTVSDTGIGIPAEAIPHLFSKFFRVSNQLQKANKGTGLGLYIAKSIIEKLQGKIWVKSAVGKGSQFSFTLPIVTQGIGMLNQGKFVSEAIQAGTLNY
ncbi:PAS domain S-box protein [Candidatus Daviesbacteria bacterium]|nr:PAS domain S-box protein [Candidatus Daviesbacteria bacterium]